MAVTKPAYDEATLARWSAELEGKEPEEILRWAVKQFQPGLTHACSFGGPSGMVILDMIMKIDPRVEVFYLDTDFLFPQTYELRDVCEVRYGFKPIGYKSLITVEEQAGKYGEALWLRGPGARCKLGQGWPKPRAPGGKKALAPGNP